MEPLVELPVERWPILQERLKKLWPLNVAGYYALHLNLKCPPVREAFQFKVYCPYGDVSNSFIGISVKGPKLLDLIVFQISEDTTKLEEGLLNTKLIDWSQKVCIDIVTSKSLQIMEKIKPIMDFTHYFAGEASAYFLDKTTELFDNLRCPSNTYLAPVKKEHISRVDDAWPYKHSASQFYFSTLASSGLSYGLYSSSNNILRAWLFLNEYNFLCHLYCDEGSRRKGYGEYLMKYVINESLRQGNDVYGYVVPDNVNSSKLFIKLGFKIIDHGAYIYVTK